MTSPSEAPLSGKKVSVPQHFSLSTTAHGHAWSAPTARGGMDAPAPNQYTAGGEAEGARRRRRRRRRWRRRMEAVSFDLIPAFTQGGVVHRE